MDGLDVIDCFLEVAGGSAGLVGAAASLGSLPSSFNFVLEEGKENWGRCLLFVFGMIFGVLLSLLKTFYLDLYQIACIIDAPVTILLAFGDWCALGSEFYTVSLGLRAGSLIFFF